MKTIILKWKQLNFKIVVWNFIIYKMIMLQIIHGTSVQANNVQNNVNFMFIFTICAVLGGYTRSKNRQFNGK